MTNGKGNEEKSNIKKIQDARGKMRGMRDKKNQYEEKYMYELRKRWKCTRVEKILCYEGEK